MSFLELADAADYKCVATNLIGSDEKHFQVTVAAPPIVDMPATTSLTVLKSDLFELTCAAAGVPAPIITWERNGRPIVDDRVLFDDEGSKVVVAQADLEDSGSWTCVATNSAGSDRVAYQVDVIQPPTALIQDEKQGNITSQINNSFSLHCQVEARPAPSIVWYHNGIPVEDADPRVKFSANRELLTVTTTSEEDAGEWSCIAENKAGSLSLSFNLEVQSPPSIFKSKKKQVPILITRGRNLRLDCRSTGNPRPEMLWTRNGMPISLLESERYNFINGGEFLEINEVSILDSTKFKCSARNVAGIDSVSYSIEVHVPPTITTSSKGIENHMTIEGESVVFRCPAQGVPSPLVTWTLNGLPVEESSRHVIQQAGRVLVVNEISRNDAGEYVCRAQLRGFF